MERIDNLEKLIDEYKKLYTEWVKSGMSEGSFSWHSGRGGSGYRSDSGYNTVFTDIHKCCEEGTYNYGGIFPWLDYKKADDSITIYSIHPKAMHEIIVFPVYTSTFPKHDLLTYANQHSLKIDFIMGRRKESGSKRKSVEVVVLHGTRTDFVQAGWESEYQKILQRQNKEVVDCDDSIIDRTR